MKRGFLLVLACVFLMAGIFGCAGVSVSTNSASTDTAKIAGKTAGVYVAAKYPDSVATVTTYAKGLLQVASEGKITSDQVTAAVQALYGMIGDDAEVKALIVAVTSAITVEIQTGTVNAQVVSALTGFVEGISAST